VNEYGFGCVILPNDDNVNNTPQNNAVLEIRNTLTKKFGMTSIRCHMTSTNFG